MAVKKKSIVDYSAAETWQDNEDGAIGHDATTPAANAHASSAPQTEPTLTDATNDGIVFGSEGNDTLGSAQAIQIFAGGGDDTIIAGTETSIIDAGAGYDRVVLTGTNGFHDDAGLASGWVGVEAITGTQSSDTINAGLPWDGQDGIDFDMRGGDDAVIATSGNDTIAGGAGNDTLTGGAGADVFVFSDASVNADVITDFSAGTDKISLSGLAANYQALVIEDGADGAVITAGVQTIVLAGISSQTLSQSDFIF